MKNIKDFNQFINELKVSSHTSGSGYTKVSDIILDMPSDAKSLSAGVLLKDKLRRQEFNDVIKLISKFDGNGKIDIDNPIAITLNNLQFLKKKRESGKLKCEYCNKGPLRVYDFNIRNNKRNSKFNRNDGATCDHKIPISKGGDRFNYQNLAVCCYDCNNKKNNMNFEDWMLIVPTLKKY